jgi:hypothetical protein
MHWLSTVAAAACLAAPVHHGTVKAGPFTGYLSPKYDVVDGRFRLHVGGYRDRKIGLSQKIAWFVPVRYKVRDSLLVTGRRLGGPGRYADRFSIAFSSDAPGAYVFPTDIALPRAGCWRLTFRSGNASGTLIALVR